MLFQQYERLVECVPHPQNQPSAQNHPYYVELPLEALDDQGRLLVSVISFTFDTLNVQHLDLRIVADAH